MQCNILTVRTFILIFMIIFFSCKSEDQSTDQKKLPNKKESLEEINRLLVDKDTELIKSYIERRGWEMTMTKSGLWYMIYKEGTGDVIKKGDYITYNYKVWLLDGTLIYTSDELGAKSFVVGKGGVESGLEEGVLLLKENSKARLILPPHLAHGLIGDENKIPARSILVYDIEILNIDE